MNSPFLEFFSAGAGKGLCHLIPAKRRNERILSFHKYSFTAFPAEILGLAMLGRVATCAMVSAASLMWLAKIFAAEISRENLRFSATKRDSDAESVDKPGFSALETYVASDQSPELCQC